MTFLSLYLFQDVLTCAIDFNFPCSSAVVPTQRRVRLPFKVIVVSCLGQFLLEDKYQIVNHMSLILNPPFEIMWESFGSHLSIADLRILCMYSIKCHRPWPKRYHHEFLLFYSKITHLDKYSLKVITKKDKLSCSCCTYNAKKIIWYIVVAEQIV